MVAVNQRKWKATAAEPEIVLRNILTYWHERAEELGCGEMSIDIEVSRQAIVDFLEDPNRMVRHGGKIVPFMWEKHKKTSYQWLFGDPGHEFDFAWFCRWLGPDQNWARCLLYEAAFLHRKLPMEKDVASEMAKSESKLTQSDAGVHTNQGGSENGAEEGSW